MTLQICPGLNRLYRVALVGLDSFETVAEFDRAEDAKAAVRAAGEAVGWLTKATATGPTYTLSPQGRIIDPLGQPIANVELEHRTVCWLADTSTEIEQLAFWGAAYRSLGAVMEAAARVRGVGR